MRISIRHICAAAIAALTLDATGAPAQTTLEDYLNAVDAAAAGLRADCEAIGEAPPDGRVWLRSARGGVEIAPADADAAAAAAFWAEATLGARRAAERLYGAAATGSLAEPVMIEAEAGRVTVHDGASMASGDVCDAMSRMTAALGGASGGDPFAAARDAAASPVRVAIPIGGESVVNLEEPLPADAIARGPDGVVASIPASGDAVALRPRAGAAIGPGDLRIYSKENPFTPLAVVPLTILPGADTPSEGGAASLQLGGERTGFVPTGENAYLTFKVETEGRYRIASRGPGDFRAALETATGAPVASDDDSGEGYGFVISTTLAAGEYRLNLSHCCGGGGRFAVIAAPE